MTTSSRTDLCTRVTDLIIADLEQGVRPWLKPWHFSNAEGRITLALRHNGTPYPGVNKLLFWGESITNGYGSPI